MLFFFFVSLPRQSFQPCRRSFGRIYPIMNMYYSEKWNGTKLLTVVLVCLSLSAILTVVGIPLLWMFAYIIDNGEVAWTIALVLLVLFSTCLVIGLVMTLCRTAKLREKRRKRLKVVLLSPIVFVPFFLTAMSCTVFCICTEPRCMP